MQEFWNRRYAEMEFAYGIKPNEFFKEQIDQLKPGKVLLPAEGEGRNAVYAASKGWEVYAFDFSEEAKNKAEKLAKRLNVRIKYFVSGIDKFDIGVKAFDLIALIYAHFPHNKQREYHRKIQQLLRLDGVMLLEGFSENQYNRTSGGPKKKDMLFTINQLRQDFNLIKNARIIEEKVFLNEGLYHQGLASVIRLVGKRNKY